MTDANSAQDIISKALLLAGVIAEEEQPSAAQIQNGLNRFNDMLDSWSADRLMVFTVQRAVFPLTSQQTYTIGPGGDFDQPYAPTKIEEMYIQVNTTQPPSEVPVEIVEAQQWSQITVKSTTSPIPREAWVDYQFPLCNISLFPIPTGENSLVLYQWQELPRLANVNSDISFPQGYRLGIIYNLAEVLAPFHGRKLGANIMELAMRFRTTIARRNLPEHLMQCDLGTLSPSKTFNWLTGEAR